jgi:hypothetical protein
MSLYGELPLSPVVMAACDSKYFIEHAPSFIYSATEHDFDVHVHVVNPTDEVLSLAALLSSTVDKRVTYSFHDMDFKEFAAEQERAYYACTRFAVAPHVLQTAKKILILDIDCMIMDNFEFPELPVGYFPRTDEVHAANDWERQGMKVAAGAVYLHVDAMNVAQAIAATIEGLPVRWFNDQIALSHIIDQLPEEVCHKFDNEFMDWEFEEGTSIWTGKGPRKYENETYVAKKKSYNRLPYIVWKYDNVILKPRMDIMFKRNGLTIANSVNEPIREHWVNFVEKKKTEKTLVVEAPKWFFNKTICDQFKHNQTIYVPHVEKEWWGGNENCKYYMQTVFPWLFTVDSKGWFGGSEYKDTFNEDNVSSDSKAFNELREYVQSGGTKFKHLQGNREWNRTEPYVLVPIQIPHDETIKYHSDVTVPEMVKAMCEWADNGGVKVVFKGHPVNLGAMQPLMDIIEQYDNVEYVTDYPIGDMIKKSSAVYVINSGTGQESMLYDRPVVVFGRCDYERAAIKGDINDLESTWESVRNDDLEARLYTYRKWFNWFVNDIAFDTRS